MATGVSIHAETDNAIDLVEAAYNLELGSTAWLPNLLRVGAPVLNLGQGCAGAIWAGTSAQGKPLLSQFHAEDGPPDLAVRLARVAGEMVPGCAPRMKGSRVRTLGDLRSTRPEMHEALTKRAGCEDMLALWAIDTEFFGVGIHMPSATEIALTPKARARWHGLSAHIAAGYRLRRTLGQTPSFEFNTKTSLPLGAEAVFDPGCGAVVEAHGAAKVNEALAAIRDAAVGADVAKGRLRATEPSEALSLWEALIQGRWSLVDWFDTDHRRFVLALPNAPGLPDPRGLTPHEYQVAIRMRAGENSKGIADDLGISLSRVSHLRRCAMRKLRARTAGQLVAKMRMF